MRLTKGQQARFVLLQVDACSGGDCLRSKAVQGAESGKSGLQRISTCTPLAADAQNPDARHKMQCLPGGAKGECKVGFFLGISGE